MRNFKNLFKIIAILSILLSFASCGKDFLDVNKNPNNPEDVNLIYILPSAQGNIAYTVGNQLSLTGGFWGQYWTQGPNANQYNTLDRYVYNSTDSDRPWSQLYTALTDLNIVIEKAKKDNSPNHAAIAYLLKAYTFQVITDAWGDIPLSQALQGADNTTPKYDPQSSVYDSIISMINTGMLMINPDAASPHAEDLIFGGDMEQWYRFGNSLKLKVLLRQVYKNPSVGTKIAALDGEIFLDHDAQLHFTTTRFNQNPLYTTGQALGTNSNIFGSSTIINYLKDLNDPRLEDYYNPNGAGNFVGIQQGKGRSLPAPQSDASYSIPSSQIIGASSPVSLMTVAETHFLIAEAIARGYLTGSETDSYNDGVAASWSSWQFSSTLTPGDLTAYLAQDSVAYPTGSSLETRVRFIINQKWIAMCGNQNFEGWTEWRRTGYPLHLSPSYSSVLGSGVMPSRILYPSDEISTNSNTPGGLLITNKVWWDAN